MLERRKVMDVVLYSVVIVLVSLSAAAVER